MTSDPAPPPDASKSEELRLRKTEVHTQVWAGVAQVVLAVATVFTVFVALWVARQGQQSLKGATQNNLEQAQDSQFSTALTSLGSGDVTERVAGLTLLELNAADRLSASSIAAFGKQSAYNYYGATLDIYSGYLHSHGVGSTVTAVAGQQPFGVGYGAPGPGAFSIDVQYAADEIAKMLGLKSQVRAISSVTPSFDLADVELYEVNFKGMDLSWVNAYMYGVDLRGAVLENVHLSKLDDMASSHLQCADLKYANLQGANLTDANLGGADLYRADLQGANLTGANLSGADLYHVGFQGANLTGADFRGAYVRDANFAGAQDSTATFTSLYGPATGLPPDAVIAPGKPPTQPPCLTNPSYGDPPKPGPAPPPSRSPSPSPSPSPKPSPTVTGRKP